MAALAAAVVLVTGGIAAPAGAGAAPTTGHAWAPLTLNPSSTYNVLDSGLGGVSAVAGSNAWAVGSYDDYRARASATLILHWNGTAWTQVKSPNPSPSPFSSNANYLNGVSARSGSNAWAVGYYDNNAIANTLVLHWNGTAWTQVKSPNLPNNNFALDRVRARSGTTAWAVGSYNDTTGASKMLILHWNGTAWANA